MCFDQVGNYLLSKSSL